MVQDTSHEGVAIEAGWMKQNSEFSFQQCGVCVQTFSKPCSFSSRDVGESSDKCHSVSSTYLGT